MLDSQLILASRSPRRQALLTEAGVPFVVCPADVDETALPRETPAAHVSRLARAKADAIANRQPQALVLGADTVVVFNDRIHGKPASLDEARTMLASFSGTWHQVLTGVALLRISPRADRVWVCRTEVHFRPLDEADISRYLHRVDPLDKAGAYAIQEHGDLLIDEIRGLRSNVIGLPVEQVLHALKTLTADDA